jgi:1,4-alpha-glucan branching enzyme
MEEKSFEKAKPKTKRARFNLWASGPKRVFLVGDFNGCVLVIPEVFGTHEHITPYQGRFHDYLL